MKNTTIGMNFCWNPLNTDILETYINYIDWCDKHKIKIIRIIFSKWGLNCIYNKEDVILLKQIVQYASIKNINIIITLLNFTDFNTSNYLDINNEKFSWKFNKYRIINKKVSIFFKKIDNALVEDIIYVLDSLIEYNNIEFIEIMNEIDQVNCNDIKLINWCNKLIEILAKKYQKYIFTCSISNYQKFNLYRGKLNCYVDLHFYSFPRENAFKNLQYVTRVNKEILYFGEYAKNSDYSYMDDYGSKIYFTSGLWGSYFLKLTYSAMSWWWDDIIINSDYEKIIDFYNTNNSRFQFDNFEEISTEGLSIEYNNNSTNKRKYETYKIIERIINLLRHPLFIFKEFKSIKKFISRKVKKENSLTIYRIISKSKKIFYIECNEECIIDLNHLVLNKKIYIYDLIKCEKNLINIKEKSKINIYGCYILEEK